VVVLPDLDRSLGGRDCELGKASRRFRDCEMACSVSQRNSLREEARSRHSRRMGGRKGDECEASRRREAGRRGMP